MKKSGIRKLKNKILAFSKIVNSLAPNPALDKPSKTCRYTTRIIAKPLAISTHTSRFVLFCITLELFVVMPKTIVKDLTALHQPYS